MEQSYDLHTISLHNSDEISKYTELLKNEWNNNVYYCIAHLQYFKREHETLEYFLLYKNKVPVILMPFICRIIPGTNHKNEYYDVISPYGYSGPLLKDSVDAEDLKTFWKLIDQWYKDNNVVSEFVRFSLNGNHENYSGTLIPSLFNIKGNLVDNFEDQWTLFLSKVRNNFRKAENYNLEFKIYHQDQIKKELISIFNEIYVATMHRNNADSIYFFSKEYFENLILSNKQNFSLAIAFYEEVPISVELIINYEDTIYAYLGGTNADYFSYRPNDFLRVKIIEWAIKNGFTKYVLGGGMKDGDGLYKSKKSLFPKDDDAIFYTGRKIINQKIYDQLSEAKDPRYTSIPIEDLKNFFFPFYRS